MYTPTKEELEELGFIFSRQRLFGTPLYTYSIGKVSIYYDGSIFIRNFNMEYLKQNFELYPQSLGDLKTLIRILTK